jgi:hypothetical protein
VCVSGLATGDHTVNETSPPPGYGGAPAGQADQKVTVVAGTDCSGNHDPGAGATATFTNPPLADIQVNFRDGGSGETTGTIDCKPNGGSSLTPDSTTPNTDGNWETSAEFDDLEPGQCDCTVVVDP